MYKVAKGIVIAATFAALSLLGSGLCHGADDPQSSTDSAKRSAAEFPSVSYSGGNGVDCANAIVIHGAGHTGRGIAAEKSWIAARYPGFVFRRQLLRRGGFTATDSDAPNRAFDIIDIETKSGERLSICFDITEFFGK